MFCIKNGELVHIGTGKIIQTYDLFPIEIISNFVLMSDNKFYRLRKFFLV